MASTVPRARVANWPHEQVQKGIRQTKASVKYRGPLSAGARLQLHRFAPTAGRLLFGNSGVAYVAYRIPSASPRFCGNGALSAFPGQGVSVAPIHEGALRVFKVYDETRQPADWSSLVGATQCAVFLKNVKTANPLATDGREIDHLRDCTFLLFDHLEEARTFCEAHL